MNLCWTKVPAGFTLTDHIAGVYCQRLGARLYRADVNSVALCFKGQYFVFKAREEMREECVFKGQHFVLKARCVNSVAMKAKRET